MHIYAVLLSILTALIFVNIFLVLVPAAIGLPAGIFGIARYDATFCAFAHCKDIINAALTDL